METVIFLVGPRASGKTTLGKALAAELACAFLDTDACLLEKSGMSVAEIVEKEGWEGFRQRESAILLETARPGTVVATGGGMVLSPMNRAFMRENGTVVYLNAPIATLAKRLLDDPNAAQRPSLTGNTIADEVTEIVTARDPLYRKTAHHIVDAGQPFDAVKAAIIQLLAQRSV